MVLDTHVLVWWLADRARLGAPAARAVDRAAADGGVIVSAISLFEIATAVRRGRLVLTRPLDQWCADVRCIAGLRIEPVGADIAEQAAAYDGTVQGDPADRLILATAHVLARPLATFDRRVRQSNVVPLALGASAARQ
ncbi:MAG: type II toxin-antitoxin system VapC family toxin [Burkholderiales bacterium]|nr:type II toxin-antitoxin system VapC family toxin [Burkholderiales bacterium]